MNSENGLVYMICILIGIWCLLQIYKSFFQSPEEHFIDALKQSGRVEGLAFSNNMGKEIALECIWYPYVAKYPKDRQFRVRVEKEGAVLINLDGQDFITYFTDSPIERYTSPSYGNSGVCTRKGCQ